MRLSPGLKFNWIGVDQTRKYFSYRIETAESKLGTSCTVIRCITSKGIF